MDKGIPVPLYYQLKQQILERILSGELVVSECLPTEMVLVEDLRVSRSTVRQAFDDLVNEGYLTREKGKGTFVCQPKIDEGFFQRLDSFNREMREKGFEPGTQVLEFRQVPAQMEVNHRLALSSGDLLLYLVRLRLADGEPVVYLETWLPYDPLKELLAVDFSTESLYHVLDARHGMRVERAIRKIEAVAAKRVEAGLLGMRSGAPVCLVRSTAYLGNGMPIEYSVARYRGDRNQFTVELVR